MNACRADLIFDVGAHKGEDSDFYLKLGFNVVAIEANPQLAEDLRARFKEQIASGQYTIVEKAVSQADEDLTFYVNDDISVWGTTDPDWAQRNQAMGTAVRKITVRGVRFADLLNKFGCPYYLKIDVEGADMLCVEALIDTEIRPKYLSLESSKISWSELINEFEFLEKLGYTRFAIVDQKQHREGVFVSRKGHRITQSFEKESSGAFGQYLPNRWYSKDEAIKKYERIFFWYRVIGDNTLLAKILHSIPLARRLTRLASWYDTHAMRSN